MEGNFDVMFITFINIRKFSRFCNENNKKKKKVALSTSSLDFVATFSLLSDLLIKINLPRYYSHKFTALSDSLAKSSDVLEMKKKFR